MGFGKLPDSVVGLFYITGKAMTNLLIQCFLDPIFIDK